MGGVNVRGGGEGVKLCRKRDTVLCRKRDTVAHGWEGIKRGALEVQDHVTKINSTHRDALDCSSSLGKDHLHLIEAHTFHPYQK
jgi:hypothetical protein